MRIKVILFVISIIYLAGCGANMVNRPGAKSNDPYAPINEAARPGLIKYLNEGITQVRDARRKDAYRKMHEACGGDYRVVNEGPRSEGGVIIPAGDQAIYVDSQYIYIEFECVNK